MPDVVKFSLGGTQELARKLESLPPVVARQIIRTALRTAVEPWREQMIARVRRGWHVFKRTKVKGQRKSLGGRSRDYAVIARNIRIRVDIGAGGYDGTAAVYPAKFAFWSYFLEKGTKKMRDFPFVEPAFEIGKNEVLANYIANVRDLLHKEMSLS